MHDAITSAANEAELSPTIALFYDFETTGLPLYGEPSEDPRQPHIVQLGVKVMDMITRQPLQAVDVIVRPNGWEIPKEASDVHGITTEMAYDMGIPEEAVAEILLELWRPERPRLRVAYNESFDARIMRIALKRHFDDAIADAWKEGRAECAMRMANPILKKGRYSKLVDAYEFFTGRKLEGAHSAMADVDGCMAVYFAVKDGITERVAA